MTDWEDRYRAARPSFEDFCDETRRLVERLMADAGIDVAQVEARTKTVDSFAEKVRRKGGRYADPVAEITDLAALRVIAYFPADVVRIGEIVDAHFAVDWENSRRQSGETEPDRFGYRSDHYVVRLSAQRLGLPEYRRFDGLRAEIQVRTVMQHAWAAVDHQLRYKNAAQLPPELQRRLSKLSALLEVADEQFAELKREADALEATYTEEVQRGDLSADVDLLSVEAYLRESGLAAAWTERALGAGLAATAEPGQLDFLVYLLLRAGVTTLEEIGPFYAGAEAWAVEFLARLAAESSARGFRPVAAPYDVLAFVLLARGAEVDVRSSPYAAVIDEALLAVRGGA